MSRGRTVADDRRAVERERRSKSFFKTVFSCYYHRYRLEDEEIGKMYDDDDSFFLDPTRRLFERERSIES